MSRHQFMGCFCYELVLRYVVMLRLLPTCTYVCVHHMYRVQEELRRASLVVYKLATQLSTETATAYRQHHSAELSKRNSGILDIVLGMPDLMATGRK